MIYNIFKAGDILKYTLMSKNTAIFDFESEDDMIFALKIEKVYNQSAAPLSIEIDDGVVNRIDFNEWLTNRRIPASRMQIESGLHTLSKSANEHITTAILAERSFYLSLSDQYWIKPFDSDVSWHDINFFTNDFSEDIGAALFDDKAVDNPDFIDPSNSSDGVLKKKWILREGKRYLLKSGSGILSQEAINEEIASELCRTLGIVNYIPYKSVIMNDTLTSVCECFIDENTELISASAALKHFLPNRRISEYQHYVNCCKRLGTDITDSLDEMFTVDFLIGNTDRHYRNFGLIRNVETLEIIGAAPLFDFGTSLFHNKPDKMIDISEDILSKPFEKFHSEQIKLVKQPERFNLAALNDFSQIAYKILKKSDIIPDERIDLLCCVLEKRLDMLKNEFESRTLDLTQKTTDYRK